MSLLHLAWASLANRRSTALLAVLAIAMSVALLLSVDKIRRDARTSFTNTVSGVDLIVGARSGAVPLLLYSVFRIGNATNDVSVESYGEIRALPGVAWTVPLSLGDSHRGYRVLGTTNAYFERYRHGDDRPLRFVAGAPFDDLFDAVLGSEVADALGYRLGDPIVVSHGTGAVGLVRHDDQPFRVTGILAPTGTPVDRTVHVSLRGIEAMHVDWRSGAKVPGQSTGADVLRAMPLEPRAITAFLVGLESRRDVFRLQRAVNEYTAEPLLAVLPGVALQELWGLVGVAEKALLVVSWFVVAAGIVNLLSVLFAGLGERRREIAILRASGARPGHVFLLLTFEAGLLAFAGIVAGLVLHWIVTLAGGFWVERNFGLALPFGWPGPRDWATLGLILACGIAAGALPAWRAYRSSLADGMTLRM